MCACAYVFCWCVFNRPGKGKNVMERISLARYYCLLHNWLPHCQRIKLDVSCCCYIKGEIVGGCYLFADNPCLNRIEMQKGRTNMLLSAVFICICRHVYERFTE